MIVSTRESRANDYAFKSTAFICGEDWTRWNEVSWMIYEEAYAAERRDSRNASYDKLSDNIANGEG